MRSVKVILHVTRKGSSWGIRLRLNRSTPGVWMGQGNANQADADTIGATADAGGWTWPTAEAAEAGLRMLDEECKSHPAEENN